MPAGANRSCRGGGAAEVFNALADPRRREILLLVRKPHSVNEIAAQFDLTQQAVSHHLRVLRDAGLVVVTPQGQRRLYSLRIDGLGGVREYLDEFWPVALNRLKKVVEGDRGR